MTPESLKAWADAISIPTLLVGLLFLIWKVWSYLVIKFIDPLGGTDGVIASFFRTTTETMKQGPIEVRLLRDCMEQNNATGNTDHKCIVSGQKDLIQLKGLMLAMAGKAATKYELDIATELDKAQAILDKYV